METRGSRSWAIFCVAVFFFAGAAAQEFPELELLEYLADWQDADGIVLDPGMFDDDHRAEPVPASEELSRVPDAID